MSLSKKQLAGTYHYIPLGTFLLTGVSAADLITDHPVDFRCEVVGLRVTAVVAPTTAAKAATLTLKRTRAATAATVTGVAHALTSASLATKGTVLTASPTGDPASKELLTTDTFSLVGSSITAFVEGSINIELVVKRLVY